jgi:hypothetical protein
MKLTFLKAIIDALLKQNENSWYLKIKGPNATIIVL